MTGLTDKDRQIVEPDLVTMREAFDVFVEQRGGGWDAFFAHEVVPAWSEEEGRVDHDDDEILAVNLSAVRCSDGALIHGFDDGSTTLGHLQGLLLGSCMPKPILVLRHARHRGLSKAWLGMQRRYPTLTFETFDDPADLYTKTQKWLGDYASIIEAGPEMRRMRAAQFAGISQTLASGFHAESDTDQRRTALEFGLAPWVLDEILSDPSQLAVLGADAMMHLLNRFPQQVARASILGRARDILQVGELKAWSKWSSTRNEQYALLVLAQEVSSREQQGVYREPEYLGQVGAWESVAEAWRNAH
jgi:hypothetical protein